MYRLLLFYLFLFGFFTYSSTDTTVSDDSNEKFFQPMEMILLFNDGRISLSIKKLFSRNHFNPWNDYEKIIENPSKNLVQDLIFNQLSWDLSRRCSTLAAFFCKNIL